MMGKDQVDTAAMDDKRLSQKSFTHYRAFQMPAWSSRTPRAAPPGLLPSGRAVYVLDASGKVVYGQIVPEVTEEPDYNPSLEAARVAAGA